MELRVLSGGAAAAVVKGIQHKFEQQYDCHILGTFSAVGEMRDKFIAGEPCDVIILTKSLIAQLVQAGLVVENSQQSLGLVQTGIAVKQGCAHPKVSTPEELAESFKAAKAIYCPDTKKSTAGIHFLNVLKQLKLDQALASKLREFPNGATAMKTMAQCPESDLIGCTQVTEINYTADIELVANLPKAFELATDYTLGVCANSSKLDLAKKLANWLCGPESIDIRRQGGFEF